MESSSPKKGEIDINNITKPSIIKLEPIKKQQMIPNARNKSSTQDKKPLIKTQPSERVITREDLDLS